MFLGIWQASAIECRSVMRADDKPCCQSGNYEYSLLHVSVRKHGRSGTCQACRKGATKVVISAGPPCPQLGGETGLGTPSGQEYELEGVGPAGLIGAARIL